VRLVHQPVDELTWPALGPVRLVGEEVVNGVDVDARGVIVEHEAVGELAPHGRSVAKAFRPNGLGTDRRRRCRRNTDGGSGRTWHRRVGMNPVSSISRVVGVLPTL